MENSLSSRHRIILIKHERGFKPLSLLKADC
jgi:hypothetical protein